MDHHHTPDPGDRAVERRTTAEAGPQATRHMAASGSRSRAPAFGDGLGRTERHLALVGRERGRAALHRWRTGCPALTDAPVGTAAELPAWVRTQPAATANGVLGHLLGEAQAGDQLALVAVLACLAPGIRALARRAGVSVDEALSEVTVGAMTFPVQRRTAIAGGLLLDARNRLWRAARRRAAHMEVTTSPLDPDTHHPVADGELGDATEIPTAQRLVQLVCQAHRHGVVDHVETQLILRTRVAGHPIRPVADHLGLTPTAAYQRRSRAESRLAHAP